MCGVRCTPNLAAYCNNGLHLTSRGRGAIFKLLHKLCFFFLCFIPLLFIVGIRYDEATLQPLIRGVLHLPFFVVAFLLFALHALLQCSVLFKPPLQVYNFTLRRFRVFLLHCCRLYWRRFVACCFHTVVSLFLITLQRYKHIYKRVSNFQNKCLFFNVYYNYNIYLGTFVNIYKHFITIIYNYICLWCNNHTIYVRLYAYLIYKRVNVG